MTGKASQAKSEIVRLNSRIKKLEKEIFEKRALEESFGRRLGFEKLLAEISSVYTNLPATEVGNSIVQGLERIGKFLGADRCNLSQFSKNLNDAHLIHSWCNEGIRPLPPYTANIGSYFPWILDQVCQGKAVRFSHLDDLPEAAEKDKQSLSKTGMKSHAIVPLSVGRQVLGALSIDNFRNLHTNTEEFVEQLRRVGDTFANALARKQKDLEIQKALTEIQRLKDQLKADYVYLREEIDLEYGFHQMIGQSEPIKAVFHKIDQISNLDNTVIIQGESGTGKELVARAIHGVSLRKDRPMVKVNCAALPANLIESELFGHEKGAFTGAEGIRVGRFELADGSTLFLDEIGELPMESQAKLLRVLQEGRFEHLGSSKTQKVDVRIIAATNRNLLEEVEKGRFRQDLWYRLNVFPITVPPLRGRKEDIPLLVNEFVNRSARKLGKDIRRIPAKVMKQLELYQWPGNVRELENVIERAVINTRGMSLQLLDSLSASEAPKAMVENDLPLEDVERNYILQVLEKTHWRITGPKGAALILKIHPSTLRFRMKKLGIERSLKAADKI